MRDLDCCSSGESPSSSFATGSMRWKVSGPISCRRSKHTPNARPTGAECEKPFFLHAVREEDRTGNGLLHRRAFIRGGAALAGVMTGYSLVQTASAQQLADDRWSLEPG